MTSKETLFCVLILSISNCFVAATDVDCGFFNEVEITDPAGDAAPGSSPSIDVASIQFQQLGASLVVSLRSNGSTYDSEDIDCLLFFDTDRNSGTGNQSGGVGAEFEVWVWTLGGYSVVSFFDSDGLFVGQESGPSVSFLENGFDFTISLEDFSPEGFTFNFDVSGGGPSGADSGSPTEIDLLPTRPPLRLVVDADTKVPSISPSLIIIPEKSQPVELRGYLVEGSSSIRIDSAEIEFNVGHPAPHAIPNPEEIISVDSTGFARSHSEGYVSVTASFEECGLSSEELIIAGGDLIGSPGTDNVIAVFPDHYAPGDSPFTFGDMMSTYPNYIKTVNIEYNITSDLYSGFVPFEGDTQVFALLDIPDHCGGASNPLETGPCCYMDCGTGVPDYITAAHEMGHNFHDAPAMVQLLWSNSQRFGGNFAYECVASLPVNYMFREIYLNGHKYGLGPGTYEWGFFSQFAVDDNFVILEDFEDYLDAGQTTGYFDMEGIYGYFDIISLFCSFFQAYLFEYEDYSSPYGHEFLRRFLNVWGNERIPNLQEEKIETYFAASFCAAVGKDVRDKLRYWGFTIDDAFYDQIMPMIESRIELFSSRFEFGDLHKWSDVKQ